MVEHRTFNPGVEGSNPSRLTNYMRPVRLVVRTVGFQPTNRSSILLQATRNGRLAQLGEHLPYKQGVAGSSPATPTIKFLKAELSSSGLGHMPVTHEIAGSNPVSSAI